MERAIRDLCSLSDENFFSEIAVGIGCVVENVNKLDAAANILSKAGQHHPTRIMENAMTEEAAKVLILIDAVRCPRKRDAERSRTLGYFYNHLAKGIYAETCDWRTANFAEAASYIENERAEYYLDGPNDVDWIFPNRIKQHREDDLYVGYSRDDTEADGRGDCYWSKPFENDLFGYSTPSVVKVIRALYAVGLTTPEGLKIIADIWRAIEPRPDMRFDALEGYNRNTIEALNKRFPVLPNSGTAVTTVIDRWPYPLWPLDLSVRKVKKGELRAIRDKWYPEEP